MSEPPVVSDLEGADTKQLEYRVFLLRLWRTGAGTGADDGAWRCSLEDPASHHRRGFESIEALAVFLRALAEAPRASGKARRNP